jgi:hypothetical protein
MISKGRPRRISSRREARPPRLRASTPRQLRLIDTAHGQLLARLPRSDDQGVKWRNVSTAACRSTAGANTAASLHDKEPRPAR